MSTRLRILLTWPRRALDWLCQGRPDYEAFKHRRSSPSHRARRTRALYVWAGASLLMLICPSPGCLLTAGLIATFVSFTLLDG
ncbi:hypothetical protein CKO25_12955 [Thiocapsa imhoffii]|uniref:Uncharacterized protein n=1 Tax=Thiocapsa imhoffii TaxID=382777 RepID=A0A9X0WJL9_9GAMM|nr:hypothetical protein [Thiocapsa imhoffii]MBK1645534.1 hypothetical protein [Thiocapsa imhoffii]